MTISLPQDKVTDSAGNNNTQSNLLSWSIDTVSPTVELSKSFASSTNLALAPVKMQVSEPLLTLPSSAHFLISGTTIQSITMTSPTTFNLVLANTVDQSANIQFRSGQVIPIGSIFTPFFLH